MINTNSKSKQVKNKSSNLKNNLNKTLDKESTRRDFITLSATSMCAAGAVCASIPFIDSMNPSADVEAKSSVEVDLSEIKTGQTKVIKWRGKPVFIKNRTQDEISQAENIDISILPDPESDSNRVKDNHKEWLVTIGVCTHLGCVPTINQGDYNGWFCACHGSHYDTSGRVRKGPAPKNLEVPSYKFISDKKILIG